jgi:hypothetical protein
MPAGGDPGAAHTATRSCRRSAITVAQPVAVRPTRMVPCRRHGTCRRQRWRRGWHTRTHRPVRGSHAWVWWPVHRWHTRQASQRVSSASESPGARGRLSSMARGHGPCVWAVRPSPHRCAAAARTRVRSAAALGAALTACAGPQAAMDRCGAGRGGAPPARLVDPHACQELSLFLGREGRLLLGGEALVKPRPLLRGPRHLRQGEPLRLRQRGDRWGISRG